MKNINPSLEKREKPEHEKPQKHSKQGEEKVVLSVKGTNKNSSPQGGRNIRFPKKHKQIQAKTSV